MQSIVFYFLGLLAACVSEERSSTRLKRALDLTSCLLRHRLVIRLVKLTMACESDHTPHIQLVFSLTWEQERKLVESYWLKISIAKVDGF